MAIWWATCQADRNGEDNARAPGVFKGVATEATRGARTEVAINTIKNALADDGAHNVTHSTFDT